MARPSRAALQQLVTFSFDEKNRSTTRSTFRKGKKVTSAITLRTCVLWNGLPPGIDLL
jgi:hypothetical protein